MKKQADRLTVNDNKSSKKVLAVKSRMLTQAQPKFGSK